MWLINKPQSRCRASQHLRRTKLQCCGCPERQNNLGTIARYSSGMLTLCEVSLRVSTSISRDRVGHTRVIDRSSASTDRDKLRWTRQRVMVIQRYDAFTTLPKPGQCAEAIMLTSRQMVLDGKLTAEDVTARLADPKSPLSVQFAR